MKTWGILRNDYSGFLRHLNGWVRFLKLTIMLRPFKATGGGVRVSQNHVELIWKISLRCEGCWRPHQKILFLDPELWFFKSQFACNYSILQWKLKNPIWPAFLESPNRICRYSTKEGINQVSELLDLKKVHKSNFRLMQFLVFACTVIT